MTARPDEPPAPGHSTVRAVRARLTRIPRGALLAGTGALLAGVVACLVTGASPGLLVAVPLLVWLAARPFPGLVYAALVLLAPLGLWFARVEALVAHIFGGRDYALALTSQVVVLALAVQAALRLLIGGRLDRWHLVAGAASGAVLVAWSLIGFAHHGVPQTLIGVRLVVFPVAVLVIVAGLDRARLHRFGTVLCWLVVANGVAALAELAVGPVRLASWGFEQDTAIRYIDGTFRAPGLTNVNAELGLLAGAFLLGYAALRLTPAARPTGVAWHLGAGSGVLCLALSTSRSGAFLVAGGLLAAVALNRAAGRRARRRAVLLVGALVAVVATGFVVVGATGASSLFQRFEIWAGLLGAGLPPHGYGIGSVGAATNSRVATHQIFVDNYFVSVALQFGPVLAGVLVVGVLAGLVLLYRRSAGHPGAVLHLAVLAGLVCASLVIEAWEYPGAMLALAVFVAIGLRLDEAAPTPTHGGARAQAPTDGAG